jgi:hypothetical protein
MSIGSDRNNANPTISFEHVEKLFAHLYMDLGHRSEVVDDFRLYHQLNMARLMRQLLMDNSGVLNLANRVHRIKIRFMVPSLGPKTEPLIAIPNYYLEQLPEHNRFPPNYYLHPYTLDGYIRSTALILADKRFSVGDVIRYVANQFGGVHLASHLDDYDHQLLARFNDQLKVGADGVVLNCISQIANITLKALAPLMNKIQLKYDNMTAMGR